MAEVKYRKIYSGIRGYRDYILYRMWNHLSENVQRKNLEAMIDENKGDHYYRSKVIHIRDMFFNRSKPNVRKQTLAIMISQVVENEFSWGLWGLWNDENGLGFNAQFSDLNEFMNLVEEFSKKVDTYSNKITFGLVCFYYYAQDKVKEKSLNFVFNKVPELPEYGRKEIIQYTPKEIVEKNFDDLLLDGNSSTFEEMLTKLPEIAEKKLDKILYEIAGLESGYKAACYIDSLFNHISEETKIKNADKIVRALVSATAGKEYAFRTIDIIIKLFKYVSIETQNAVFADILKNNQISGDAKAKSIYGKYLKTLFNNLKDDKAREQNLNRMLQLLSCIDIESSSFFDEVFEKVSPQFLKENFFNIFYLDYSNAQVSHDTMANIIKSLITNLPNDFLESIDDILDLCIENQVPLEGLFPYISSGISKKNYSHVIKKYHKYISIATLLNSISQELLEENFEDLLNEYNIDVGMILESVDYLNSHVLEANFLKIFSYCVKVPPGDHREEIETLFRFVSEDFMKANFNKIFSYCIQNNYTQEIIEVLINTVSGDALEENFEKIHEYCKKNNVNMQEIYRKLLEPPHNNFIALHFEYILDEYEDVNRVCENTKSEVLEAYFDKIFLLCTQNNDTHTIKILLGRVSQDFLETNFEKKLFRYYGTPDGKQAFDVFCRKVSPQFFEANFDKIIEISVDSILAYTGSSEDVFQKAITSGFFENKTDEEIKNVLTRKDTLAKSTVIIKYLIKNRSPKYIEYYKGNLEEIYIMALDNGYVVTSEVLDNHPEFIRIEPMMKKAIENDPFCAGYELIGISKEELLKTIYKTYGSYEYKKIVKDKKRAEEIYSLSQILSKPDQGPRFLRIIGGNFLQCFSFEFLKTLLKYAINNPYLSDLCEIDKKKELKDFSKVYGILKKVVNNDKVYGVEKFLGIAHLYNHNSSLAKDISKKIEAGYELTNQEIIDLQILVSEDEIDETFHISQLGELTDIKRKKNLLNLEQKPIDVVKDELFRYLFNTDANGISLILERNINSQTVINILDRARKENNEELTLIAERMKVLVDIIEQLNYCEMSENELKEFAKRIYGIDPKRIARIRKEFINIKERVREFYEAEANYELTNISAMTKNPAEYTEYISESGEKIKIIDLSKKKHALYAHILSTDVDTFFDRDNGIVTISVSVETDLHEAYYYGNPKGKIVLVFSNIPKGAFITSAPTNMQSSDFTKKNDYRLQNEESISNQLSMRNSYDDSLTDNDFMHTETLLYRNNLIPCGIIITGDMPTKKEIECAKAFERKIKEVTGRNIEIPLIKTQGHNNRVVNYQEELHRGNIVLGFEKEEATIQALRKEFFGILDLDESKVFVRKKEKSKYTVIDGVVYILKDDNDIEQANMKIARTLQTIVHGKDAKNIMDIRTVTLEEQGVTKRYFGVKSVDARKMWQYKRKNGAFSRKANSMLLKEFMVDHLMCNYQSSNDDFLMGVDNTIYGINKEHAFDAVDDFINNDGVVYTRNVIFIF